jgi:hypothetical protein
MRYRSGVKGGGALKRTRKKILVKQLKEWRENEVVVWKKKMQKKKKDDKIGEDRVMPPWMTWQYWRDILKLAHPRCQVNLGHQCQEFCSKKARFNLPILWQDNDNEDNGSKDGPLGVVGGGALKRIATKILVKQL